MTTLNHEIAISTARFYFESRGYRFRDSEVPLVGQESTHKMHTTKARVDLILEKNNELIAVECGALSGRPASVIKSLLSQVNHLYWWPYYTDCPLEITIAPI